VWWEIVVVNNNCADGTDTVVGRFFDRLPVRLTHEPNPGLSHARNRGVAECRGEYIVFTDDDVRVSQQWIANFVNAASAHPDAAVFGGPVYPWFPAQPDRRLVQAFPAIRNGFCGIDHKLPLGSLPNGLRLTGANLAFKAAVLKPLRFDPRLGVTNDSLGGGEETAIIRLIQSAGHSVIWVPDMTVEHYVDPSRMRVRYLIRMTRDRGRSKVREKGIPPGRSIAGVPLQFCRQWASATGAALLSLACGNWILAAGHFAKAEGYRAKISESRALRRAVQTAASHLDGRETGNSI
jgi:glycosyltransferase involved in cell wall biosynthesis